jgi:hypothetical protein
MSTILSDSGLRALGRNRIDVRLSFPDYAMLGLLVWYDRSSVSSIVRRALRGYFMSRQADIRKAREEREARGL